MRNRNKLNSYIPYNANDEEIIAQLKKITASVNEQKRNYKLYAKKRLLHPHLGLQTTPLYSLLNIGYSRDITASLEAYFDALWIVRKMSALTDRELAHLFSCRGKLTEENTNQLSPLLFALTMVSNNIRTRAPLVFITHLTHAVQSQVFKDNKDAFRNMVTAPIKGGFNCLHFITKLGTLEELVAFGNCLKAAREAALINDQDLINLFCAKAEVTDFNVFHFAAEKSDLKILRALSQLIFGALSKPEAASDVIQKLLIQRSASSTIPSSIDIDINLFLIELCQNPSIVLYEGMHVMLSANDSKTMDQATFVIGSEMPAEVGAKRMEYAAAADSKLIEAAQTSAAVNVEAKHANAAVNTEVKSVAPAAAIANKDTKHTAPAKSAVTHDASSSYTTIANRIPRSSETKVSTEELAPVPRKKGIKQLAPIKSGVTHTASASYITIAARFACSSEPKAGTKKSALISQNKTEATTNRDAKHSAPAESTVTHTASASDATIAVRIPRSSAPKVSTKKPAPVPQTRLTFMPPATFIWNTINTPNFWDKINERDLARMRDEGLLPTEDAIQVPAQSDKQKHAVRLK